ncbi:radical SAM protein [Janthinobacterium fluminis]|uniref:Radical SAM protein n=1 Tax=Janthinobacterium fluminis TaxID=2987524 RepID=A0ABT5K147_9BURK|nr:radical SAM protein [Janthinobacterium fluminis]MDC8757482.1 radical SAM protein [Janthinobacterium fluminis]
MLIGKRLPNLRTLSLSWFGGAPLIAKDIVKDLTQYAQESASSAKITFSSDMTTNAYTMNRETFSDLLELGITSYQISLDGNAEEHDKTRKLVSQKGTFEKIWQNLLAMRALSTPFNIVLRVHLHADNVESVKELLSRISQDFAEDPRFSIFLKAVGNWGGEKVGAMNLIKSPTDTISDLNQILRQSGWFERRETRQSNAATKNQVPQVRACYAALPNSFVIRADGSLAKCTVAFNDPRNRIGQLNDDGTLSIEKESMHSFMRGLKSMQPSDLACPIKEMPQRTQVISFHKSVEIGGTAQ